jgi:hypothetical protein
MQLQQLQMQANQARLMCSPFMLEAAVSQQQRLAAERDRQQEQACTTMRGMQVRDEQLAQRLSQLNERLAATPREKVVGMLSGLQSAAEAETWQWRSVHRRCDGANGQSAHAGVPAGGGGGGDGGGGGGGGGRAGGGLQQCQEFRRGTCRHGANCRFAHNEDDPATRRENLWTCTSCGETGCFGDRNACFRCKAARPAAAPPPAAGPPQPPPPPPQPQPPAQQQQQGWGRSGPPPAQGLWEEDQEGELVWRKRPLPTTGHNQSYYRGKIIGKGGTTLRAISEATGARVDLPRDSAVVIVQGNAQQVRRATAIVDGLLHSDTPFDALTMRLPEPRPAPVAPLRPPGEAARAALASLQPPAEKHEWRRASESEAPREVREPEGPASPPRTREPSAPALRAFAC